MTHSENFCSLKRTWPQGLQKRTLRCVSPLSTCAFPSWSCTPTRVQTSEPATPGWWLEGRLLSPWVCSSIYNMGRSDQISGFQVCFVFSFVSFFKHLSPSFKGNFKGKCNCSSTCGLPAGRRRLTQCECEYWACGSHAALVFSEANGPFWEGRAAGAKRRRILTDGKATSLQRGPWS